MIEIRPVSDLRNRFKEIEATVKEGKPVYLTKNGYGTMVVAALTVYSTYGRCRAKAGRGGFCGRDDDGTVFCRKSSE